MRYTKFFAAFVLSLLYLQLQAQTDNARFAPNLIQLLKYNEMTSSAKHPNFATQSIKNKSIVSLLMKVNDQMDETRLRTLGANVGTKAGNIWTLRVPTENLKAVTELKGIVYMEVAQQVRMQMDSARYAANIDSVIQGVGLPMPLRGKGVVVGVIDGGFDYTHPAFYDTSYSNLRIKKAWVQGISGTPPAGYTYGAEFSDTASLL
jgi:minor extracellular serine protease Vpr